MPQTRIEGTVPSSEGEGRDVMTVRPPAGGTFVVLHGWKERLWGDDGFLTSSRVRARECLKETPSRLVERVWLRDGGRVVVKRYRTRSALEGWKLLWPMGAAWREWRAGRELMAHGLPVATPILHGRCRAEGEQFLVTEDVPAADLLDLWASHGTDPLWRRAVIGALGRLYARLHDAGFCHGDPHLGNFLLAGSGLDLALTLIDLRRVRHLRADRRDEREGDLALVFRSLGGLVGRTDRLRFVLAYSRSRQEALSRFAVLGQRGAEERREYLLRRARVAMGTNRRFSILSAGGRAWHVRHGTDDPSLQAILANPDEAFESPDQVLKWGRSAQVVRVGPWVVKRTRSRRLTGRLKEPFRRGKALRAMKSAFLLEIFGLPTPLAAAASRSVRGGAAYLVTRNVPGALHADQALVARETPERGELVDRLGNLVGRLHQEGISHRDLKAGNVVVDGAGQPWFVDLDGIRPRVQLDHPRRASDLARLIRDLRQRALLNEEEQLRLVRAYAQRCQMSAEALTALRACLDQSPRLAAR